MPAPASARRHCLDGIDRIIGRLSMGHAVLLLTAVAVVAGQALSALLWYLFYGSVVEGVVLVSGLAAAAVAAPIIFHAQRLIRSLDQSKKDLRRLAEHLIAARDEAQAASRSKSRFLANMSHELRTPLNAIIGFSDILKRQILGPIGTAPYIEYAADINASGEHLLNIINDILDLAKIEAGALRLEEEAIEPGRLIHETMRVLALEADTRRVAIACGAMDDLPVITGSARMLRQILLNLLSNAVKFTPPGGRVEVGAEISREGELLVAISDTGTGMTEEGLAVALTPFGQVEDILSRRNGGTGLGLPLSKALAELHDGRLEIESAPGRGTTVLLRFPAWRVQPRP